MSRHPDGQHRPMNPVQQLLDEVLATGRPPTLTAVAAAIGDSGSSADRNAARSTLYESARRIAAALDSNLAQQAEQLAADVAADLADHTSDGASTDESPRALAAQIARGQRNTQHAPDTDPDDPRALAAEINNRRNPR